MPYVLAIEPDPRQAVILRRLVHEQVRADFVLADSRDVALAAIDARVPDLLLVTALLGPRDEAEINEHLKTLDGANHLQTLTIPLLAVPTPKANLRGRVLNAFMRRKTLSIEGCDPSVFGDEIATYLQRALELKAEQSQREVDLRETQGVAQAPPATVAEQDVPTVAEQNTPAVAEQDVSPVHSEAAPEPVAPLRAETRSAPVLAGDEVGPSDDRPSDLSRPLPLLHRVRLLPTLAPVGRFLEQRLLAWPAAAAPRHLLAERSAVDASEVLAVMPSGVAVSVPVRPAKPPAPSPWDELFRALERQFDRNDGKWTDLTPLLASLDEDTGESEQTGLESGSATEMKQAGPESGSATERPSKRRRRGRWRTLADPLTPIPGVDSLWVANAIASLRLDIERLRLEAMVPVVVKERGVRGTGVSPVAKSVSPADKPVSPANGRSLSAPDASSPSNGPHHHTAPGEPKTERPPQDEWGIYDPEQCGMAALMARLGTPHVEEREPRPMIPTGADANGSDTTAWEPPARAQRGPDDPPGRHLAPLSMWARMDASGDVEAERRMALPEPLAHLPALMAGLRLPEHVAAVRYGSGCRIRRVRVAGRPRKPAGGKRQVIILSRKALQEFESTGC